MPTTLREFLIEAIPTARLAMLRRTATEAPFVVAEPAAVPVRCCLRVARTGERALLVAYRPPGGRGPYAETGPVFVHAEPCEGYRGGQPWPADFADRRQVLRGYDRVGRIVDAVLAEPNQGPATLATLFGDDRIVVVHSRNVLYGCFMFLARPG